MPVPTAQAKKTPKATAAKVQADAPPPVNEGEFFRTSLYLSRAVHEKLREIAFHEHKKVHDLFVEGLDKVLGARGYPTTQEIRAANKAS